MSITFWLKIIVSLLVTSVIISGGRLDFSLMPSQLAKSVEKGAISSEIIFNSLQESFREDHFEDVSGKARFTDIIGTPPFATESPILIENKEWTQPVATQEVDKFWRDMDARNATIGCFFSM